MKNVLVRMGIGATIGVMIGYMVNLVINLFISTGEYLPVMPQLQARCANQLQAVVVQTVLTAAIGIVFAEAGMLFELAHWSFLRQCLVHFAVTAIFYLPFMILCWFPLGWGSVLGILANVLFTYALTFFINYYKNRQDIQLINAQVQQFRKRKEKTDE